MGWGERKYTDQQRTTVIYHRNVRKLSGNAISDLARRGELESVTGDALAPFEIPKNTVYSLARDARGKERRNEVSELVHALPADANEAIRRRLVEIVDRRTTRLVNDARRGREVDPDEVKKLARAAREIAALPGFGLRIPRPGAKGAEADPAMEGEQQAGAKSAAGALLAAAKGGAVAKTETAQEDVLLPLHANGQAAALIAGAEPSVRAEDDENATDARGDEGPGSRAKQLISSVLSAS